MKVRYLVVSAVLLCVAGSAYAGDESIKSTVRNRALRKAKAARVRAREQVELAKSREHNARDAEYARRRMMENQQHAAQMQHAINGAQQNALHAQQNAIQAERNRTLQRALGACPACGSFGHSACAGIQKSPEVLQYEAMLGRMIP